MKEEFETKYIEIDTDLTEDTKDLLKSLLKVDVDERCDINSALKHPAVTENIEWFNFPLEKDDKLLLIRNYLINTDGSEHKNIPDVMLDYLAENQKIDAEIDYEEMKSQRHDDFFKDVIITSVRNAILDPQINYFTESSMHERESLNRSSTMIGLFSSNREKSQRRLQKLDLEEGLPDRTNQQSKKAIHFGEYKTDKIDLVDENNAPPESVEELFTFRGRGEVNEFGAKEVEKESAIENLIMAHEKPSKLTDKNPVEFTLYNESKAKITKNEGIVSKPSEVYENKGCLSRSEKITGNGSQITSNHSINDSNKTSMRSAGMIDQPSKKLQLSKPKNKPLQDPDIDLYKSKSFIKANNVAHKNREIIEPDTNSLVANAEPLVPVKTIGHTGFGFANSQVERKPTFSNEIAPTNGAHKPTKIDSNTRTPSIVNFEKTDDASNSKTLKQIKAKEVAPDPRIEQKVEKDQESKYVPFKYVVKNGQVIKINKSCEPRSELRNLLPYNETIDKGGLIIQPQGHYQEDRYGFKNFVFEQPKKIPTISTLSTQTSSPGLVFQNQYMFETPNQANRFLRNDHTNSQYGFHQDERNKVTKSNNRYGV